MIPRVVIQTASPGQLHNELICAANQKLKENNPNWKFLQFSDADCDRFMETHFSGIIYSAYKRINKQYGAARADLFRYCATYVHGGIYLDIKSTATSKLDSIIQESDSYLLSQWDNRPGEKHYNWGNHAELREVPGGEFQQWFIAASPRNPILKEIIKLVHKNIVLFPDSVISQYGKNAALQLTGPIPYTIAIMQMINQGYISNGHDYRYISSEREGLIYSIFEINTQEQIFELTGQIIEEQQLKASASSYAMSHYSNNNTPIVDLRNN